MRSASYGLVLLALVGACSDDKTVVTQVPCGATGFPPAPEGTKQIVYVAKNCPADGADGSREHPFATIQLGLDRVEAGGAVLVAPGEYDEGVAMKRPVAIVGAASESEEDSVVMKPPQQIGGTVTTESDDDEVSIRGVRIVGAQGYGLLLNRGHLVLTDVVIASTARGPVIDAAGETAEVGFGLAATGGRLDATRLTVDGTADTGVIIDGASGALRDSRVSNSGLGGVRVQRVAVDFTVDTCTLADNTQLGIGIFAGPVTLTNSTISSTRLHAPSKVGDGVLVNRFDEGDTAPIAVTATGNTVTGSERVGLLFGTGAEGEVSDNEVSDSGAKAVFGAGIWLQSKAGGAAGLTMRRNAIRRSRFVGLGATSGSRASFEEGTVEATAQASTILASGGNGLIGDGVGLFDQSAVRLRGNTIKASTRYGVALDGADLASRVEDNTIDSDPAAPMKAGIAVQQGDNDGMLAAIASGNTEDGATDKAPTVATFAVRKDNFSAGK